MKARVMFALIGAGLAAARLAHVGVLWPEEALPLAAAVQMLNGKDLYREIWYDKPPLVPGVYLLWGAHIGWPLRLAGALYVLLCCFIAWRFAAEKWGRREGAAAALLLGFALTFWVPSAVIPLAADLLLLAPHLAAAYLAWRGQAFAAGAAAGLGLLFNAKAALVLVVCALWRYRKLHLLLAGFALPAAAALAFFGLKGALADFVRQVWELGFRYSGNTFLDNPLREGAVRTANWLGFHAAPALLAGWYLLKGGETARWRFAAWMAVSLAAVAAGWRFFPRYYFFLLPAVILAAARGLVLAGRRGVIALLLLLIPLVRFGPRYVLLAADAARGHETRWRDVAMDRDTRAASALLSALAKPGDTLFVWGYRPDVFAYTRMPAASRFLESQPLSGVLADRHLFGTRAISAPWLQANRAELVRTRPDFILDGIALYNPRLALREYADLRGWLENYTEVGRTAHTILYARR